MSAIRDALDPWLGPARWKQTERSAKLIYRFQSEDQPSVPLRLKIEINTTECFSVFGYAYKPYQVDDPWFKGIAEICTYSIEELMGTKLRALYQRAKGRDLYDLWLGITQLNIDCNQTVAVFKKYNQFNHINISKKEFEQNLLLKMQLQEFLRDSTVVLSNEIKWDPDKIGRAHV